MSALIVAWWVAYFGVLATLAVAGGRQGLAVGLACSFLVAVLLSSL